MLRRLSHFLIIRRYMSKSILGYRGTRGGYPVKLSYQKYELENKPLSTSTPIFILHGLLGSKKDWAQFGKTICTMTQRSVVTVDMRNHGYSARANTHRYPDMAQDMLRLFRKLSVQRASVVGHNVGARIGMCLAQVAPLKVASLLVFDMSPVSTCQEFMTVYPVTLRAMLDVNFKGKKTLKRAMLEAKKQLKQFVTDDMMMKLIQENVVVVKKKGIIGWRCNVQVLLDEFQYIASFPKNLKAPYMGPTLFIGGQLSEYLPPDDLTGIREVFPRAVVIYVPKTTHYLYVEDPSRVLELSIKFLRKYV